MGEAALALGLLERAGADEQAERGAVARLLVGADDVAQAVGQRALGVLGFEALRAAGIGCLTNDIDTLHS